MPSVQLLTALSGWGWAGKKKKILRELAAAQLAFVLLSSVSVTDVMPHAQGCRRKVDMLSNG